MRELFARERLEEAAVPRPGAAARRSLATLLFLPERLEEAPESAPRRRGTSLVRALFAPEPLAFEPPVAPRRRRRWLRWLVVPESLDPPP